MSFVVNEVNKKLNFRPGQLFEHLQTLAGIMYDREFIEQLLIIKQEHQQFSQLQEEEEQRT